MNGKGGKERISDYLRPQEAQDTQDVFRAIAHGVLYIGDADLRHQTETDWSTVQDIRRSVSGETGWTPKATEALEVLQDIIGSGRHTMLGKVYASFAAVDIIHQAGGLHSREFALFLPAAIETAPTEQESILLTAAFYSRYMGWVMTHEQASGSGQEILGQYDEKLLGLIGSPKAARRRVAVQAAAEIFISEIREDAFGMRLPEAELATSYTNGSPPHETGGYMIPQSIMYLAAGRLVSWNKLIEATQLGIPGRGQPEQRIPELLVGVEIPVGQQTHERTRTKLGYVAMRALRKPKRGRIDWTSSLQNEDRPAFENDRLFTYCSFDTLSLIAAIRIARQLTEENTPAGFSPSNVSRKVNAVMERLQEVHSTAFNRSDSILSVALRESQKIDGDLDWELPQAARHLKSQIIGLLVSDIRSSRVTWRQESELWQLYRQYVIQQELSREDKVEMMGFLLQNTQHELWRKFDRSLNEKAVNAIAQWVHQKHELPPALVDTIIEHVNKYIVQRCETIRDIHVPTVTGAKILSPDDAE